MWHIIVHYFKEIYLLKYIMVVLTIVAPSNDHTVYFDQPIPKPNYIRLLSCLLYNSWYNLKAAGKIEGKSKAFTFLPGPYVPKTLAKQIENALSKYTNTIKAETNMPFGKIIIHNTNGEHIELDNNLASLLTLANILS